MLRMIAKRMIESARWPISRTVGRTLLRDPDRWDRWLILDESYDPLVGMLAWLDRHPDLPESVRAGLDKWDTRHHGDVPHNRVWAYDIQTPVFIDPRGGWVVEPGAHLLARSRTYHLLSPPKAFVSLARLPLSRSAVHLPMAISLRDSNEGNYWHWWDDQLSKLYLAERLGLLTDRVPIIVGSTLARARFFREARARGRLARLNWHVQSGPLRVDRLIVLNGGAMQEESLAKAPTWVESPAPSNGKKIFITRAPDTPRGLINLDELRPTLAAGGYEIIDCGRLSLDEQMHAFASADRIVGVHGAALANAQWRRRASTNLTEIFHPATINPHYAWMAMRTGFRYHATTGQQAANGRMLLTPSVLAKLL